MSDAIVRPDARWEGYINAAWLERLANTPLLTRCRQGLSTRAELCQFVRQQYHYSRHFTRYLCALLSNLIDERDRLALTHNLFEEMGLAGPGGVPHAQLYRGMMAKMGVVPEADEVLPETRHLIQTMLACCSNPRHLVGLGALCLGAEAIVPYIYSTLMIGFGAIGEPTDHLEFFKIHIEGDDEHAVTMRMIIDRELAGDPGLRADLLLGAQLAIDARVEFFAALGEARQPKKVA